jgi:O-acetyl-ADP-ribose deacetylase (regulator of RNase III)
MEAQSCPLEPHDDAIRVADPIAERREPVQSPGPGAGLSRLEQRDRTALASLHVANHDRVGYQLGALEYVASSLFESPAQTLVNTVNTVGVMGKGIANDFRRLYPDMFERYQAFCADGKFAVGQLYLYRTPHKWVLNFPTKQHWRSPSRMEWIEAGLQKFLDTYSQYGITSVAFPQLGTGNGGLDWDDVRPLMERYLKQVRIPVYIHVRSHDPKFVAEHLRAGDVPALSKELHAARVDVTFERFVDDLRDAFDAQVKDPQTPEELPSLEVQLRNGSPFVITGEQMLDFWQTLKLRGALELAALPRPLREPASSFAEKLLTLEYIKPMQFGGDRRPGLRYAPPSLSHPPSAIDVNPE